MSTRTRGIAIAVGVVGLLGLIVAIVVVAFSLAATSPLAVVAATAIKIEQTSSMAFDMDMEMVMDDSATPMHLEGVMAYPTASEFTMTMEFLGQTVTYEQITLDGVAYVRYPLFSTWGYTDLDIASSSPGQSASPTDYLAYLEAVAGIEDLGDEEIAGVDCYHYLIDVDEPQVVDSMLELAADAGRDLDLSPEMDYAVRDLYGSADIRIEIWIGIEDKLPRRQIIDMQMGQAVDYAVHGVIDFSDFGMDVEIEAPEGAVPIDDLVGLMSGGQ